ncbi:T9SS type A sorting domain-containing protein, partial [Flavobacterium sp.]|uniref:T9SS type A sorting domain-containing protein n=1 Tax=Flavobacterium sp. TaxID=239 RepID=UPI00261077F0
NKSKITRFNFVGQIGKTAPGDISLIQGVHVFVFKNDVYNNRFKIPFSGTSLAHFYLDNANPGLLKRIEDEKIIISVDLNLAGKELVLEAGSYWLAFAPVVATDGLPEDKVWYWYDGDGGGYDMLVWQSGDTEWRYRGDLRSTAFSIEGTKVTLGTSVLDSHTAVAAIYPNPTDGVFAITPGQGIVLTEVYNITGQLLLKGNSDTIDLSTYPKGTYLVVITYGNGHKSNTKLIKE